MHIKIDNFLKEHSISAITAMDSVLDFLTSRYLEEHPVKSDEIERIAKEMEPYYENIPFGTSSELFRMVYDLCGNYEAAAFRQGLLIGLQLARELPGSD